MFLNDCKFLCRIASEIESKKTSSGSQMATFSIAIPSSRKDDPADFIDVVCWNNSANFASRYCNKGDKIILSGQLKLRRWEDKDGNKRKKHIINFAEIHDRIPAKVEEYGIGSNTFTEAFSEDSIPF